MDPKIFHLLGIIFISQFLQAQKNELKFTDYDSILIQTLQDNRPEFLSENLRILKVSGKAKMKEDDFNAFEKRIFLKRSFGENQAVSPLKDAEILFYKNGQIQESIGFCFYTNNVICSFQNPAQLKGADRELGIASMAGKGGMKRKFKVFVINLLLRYNLPINKKEILQFGK